MELTMRPATPAERLYADAQSQQITMQTGCVGFLCGDVGESGDTFPTVWKDRPGDEKTDEFQAELDGVVNALRRDEQYGGILKDRAAMGRYCAGHPESGFNDGLEFAFRADTARYSYLIRLNPDRGEENLSIYCYRREWLDQHMKHAEKGIRFITPHYEDKFRIEDGDSIRIFTGGGETRDRTARYIDDYHVEVVSDHGSNLYHICEFAERLERSGGRVIPLRSSLPEKCFSITSAADEIVVITKGEMGHRPAGARAEGVTAREGATALNETMGVTRAQEAAMLFGSIYGWDKSGADPGYYDEQGEPIKLKKRDRRVMSNE